VHLPELEKKRAASEQENRRFNVAASEAQKFTAGTWLLELPVTIDTTESRYNLHPKCARAKRTFKNTDALPATFFTPLPS
jgi:hypothetical protein